MDNIDIAKNKSSLYCWIILAIFITVTVFFMINFYNKAVDEISKTAGVTSKQMLLDK